MIKIYAWGGKGNRRDVIGRMDEWHVRKWQALEKRKKKKTFTRPAITIDNTEQIKPTQSVNQPRDPIRL
jgi:hypothetical protein